MLAAKEGQHPNIVIIISDHLTQRAIGAYGNTLGATPNIDKIASDGAIFTNCYSTYPLCAPARAAFWTGRLPHETGIMSNTVGVYNEPLPKSVPTVGETFKNAGYEAVHFGKTHDGGSLRGFKNHLKGIKKTPAAKAWPIGNDTYQDSHTCEQCMEYIEGKHEKPFIMVADFNNPHNICGWVGKNKGIHTDEPIPTSDWPKEYAPWKPQLPTLPDNFETDDIINRPKPIQYICCTHQRLSQAANWNEENYRYYLAAYYHYVSRVDTEIGKLYDAITKNGLLENTIFIVMADHGDGITSHRMVTKQVCFYEEIINVPFIIGGRPILSKNKKFEKPIVSHLDLFPTLCDLANLNPPSDLKSYSLKSFLMGDSAIDTQREYAVSEWVTEWGFTVSPGRMIRNSRYKYTKYLEENSEELYDLEKDTGEKMNLVSDPNYENQLRELRSLLDKHIKDTNDPFYEIPVKAPKRWRSHPIGYQNHKGPCAPQNESRTEFNLGFRRVLKRLVKK